METSIGSIKDPIEQFFAFMRERQSIFLKKEQGLERPWTDDSILNKYKFTNVFREQDRTTKWFRENVRDPLRNSPEVFLATAMFRMFNRIEIGQAIWTRMYSAWNDFCLTGNGKVLEENIRSKYPNGPWVTGAYLITSKKGMDKLTGICSILEEFYHEKYPGWDPDEDIGWEDLAEEMLGLRGEVGLEDVWNWLKGVPYFGTFHSHEMVQDLRYTSLLDQAPDINTWTNPGPGCKRGLNRIKRIDINTPIKMNDAIAAMRELLEISNNHWPNNYPALELHQIEFQLCEYDKYLRVLESDGVRRPRSLYA